METFVRLCPTLMFILFFTNVRRFSALSDGNIKDFNITASCANTTSSNENCIHSPNFPNVYSSRTDCTWDLTSMKHKRIKLTFPTFAVGGKNGLSCTSELSNNVVTDYISKKLFTGAVQNDYVDVFDIIRGNELRIGRYCELNKPQVTISTTTKLRIKFHSGLKWNFQGFRICYEFSKDSDSTEAAGMGLIGGIICGMVIIIVLTVAFGILIKKKLCARVPDKRESRHSVPIPYYLDTLALNSFNTVPLDTKRKIARNKFELGKEIGSGNFGKVFEGELYGLYGSGSKTRVAIKTVHETGTENDINDLCLEIKLLSYIDTHPNLVSMIGYCSSELESSGKVWLLIEYCEFGDLKNYLIKHKEKILCDKVSEALNTRCLLNWSHDIAKGMQYLEKSKIMHGDLAARNILMSENIQGGQRPVAKVADFGLAKKFYEAIYQKTSRVMVPWKWMAPEFLTDDIFTLKSDVWSYAVLFWEILSFGKIPYGQQQYEEVLEKLQNGYRLDYPKDTENITSWLPEKVYSSIAQICFVQDPDERANFDDVVKLLKGHLSEEEKSDYLNMIDTYESEYACNYHNFGNNSTSD